MDNKKIIEIIGIFAISIMFALGSFLFKVKTRKTKLTFFNGFSSIIFSLLASFIGYNLCVYLNIHTNLMWIVIGISSFSGIEFIKKVENFMNEYLKYKYNKQENITLIEEVKDNQK